MLRVNLKPILHLDARYYLAQRNTGEPTIIRDINLPEPLSHLLLEVLSLGRVLRPHVLVALNDHVAKMLATDDQKSCCQNYVDKIM